MRPITLLAVGAALLPLPALAQDPGPQPTERAISRAGVLYGVDGAFLGPDHAIRNIPGDEMPWEIGRTFVRLDKDGTLHMEIHGLVIPDDPSVPANLRGTNPDSSFRAVVSCLREGDKGGLVDVHYVTGKFAATPQGDATIDAKFNIKDSCVAPVLFVVGGDEMKSFAISGAELGGS